MKTAESRHRRRFNYRRKKRKRERKKIKRDGNRCPISFSSTFEANGISRWINGSGYFTVLRNAFLSVLNY